MRQYLKAAQIAWNYLKQSYFSTLMTVLVIGLALALPVGLLIVLDNVSKFSDPITKSQRLSVYLKTSMTSSQTQSLIQSLQKHPDIAEVELVSPADGLAKLQKLTGVNDVLQYLPENPLPALLIVYPLPQLSSNQDIQRLQQELTRYHEIESVQYDQDWLTRLNALLNLGHRVFLILLFGFGLGVVLIIGNTVRLATQNRRDEIEVIYLLGGTLQFIRRPFLFAGAYYGIFGGIVAYIILLCVKFLLSSPLQNLLRSIC